MFMDLKTKEEIKTINIKTPELVLTDTNVEKIISITGNISVDKLI